MIILGIIEVLEKPEWYNILAGILAIPAALMGIAYSYILIKKTRLESWKTELEIKEKEIELNKILPTEDNLVSKIIEPILTENTWRYLLLRFVLLYVILEVWGFNTFFL